MVSAVRPSLRESVSPAAIAVVLVGLVVLAPLALAGTTLPLSDTYKVRISGFAATPLWWAPDPEYRIDRTMQVDFGPVAAGATVRIVAEAEPVLSTMHLYVRDRSDHDARPVMLQDPIPGLRKSVTVAGPGSFSAFIDPGPGAQYKVLTVFEGFHGAPDTGARAAFPLTIMGTFACPVPTPQACPP